MVQKKQSILEFYVEHFEKYSKIYGDKCVVFLESGTFMEIYGENETDKQFEVCKFLHIAVGRRDKSDENSTYFAGIPTHSVKKFYKMLIADNYTIVCVNQITRVAKTIEEMDKINKNIERKVNKIISPGCALSEDLGDDCMTGQSVLVGIMFDEDTDGELYAYLGVFDVNLGCTEIESVYQELDNDSSLHKYDNNSLFSSIKEKLDTVLFHEVIISFNTKIKQHLNNDYVESFKSLITDQLQLQYKLVHFKTIDDKKSHLLDIHFQEHYLIKTFPQYVTIYNSIHHNLDIENIESECITNFIIMNDFISEHDETLAVNLPKPVWKNSKKKQYVHFYNEVYQKMNIFESGEDNKKSLFGYLNFAKTGPGSRLLRERLQYPIFDTQELSHRYDTIEEILNTNQTPLNTIKTFEQYLKIVDLQRVYRRVTIGQLQPYEIPRIIDSNRNMKRLFSWVIENSDCFPKLNEIVKDSAIVTKIEIYNQLIEGLFDVDKCYKYSLQTLAENIFLKGHFPELDDLTAQIEKCKNVFEYTRNVLDKLVAEVLPKTTEGQQHVALIKGKEAYYFDLTKKKGALLEKVINELPEERKKEIEVDLGFHLNSIEFNNSNKSKTKISFKNIHNIFAKIEFLSALLISKTKTVYIIQLKRLYDEFYSETIEPAINSFTELDCYYSCAKAAFVYNYCKPTFKEYGENDASAISLKQVRHPIIERLTQKNGVEYVPNDIELDDSHNYLLYGVNSVGKSSLLKSIALAVIMAQSGFFVSAKECSFHPYKGIFTRTGNGDNLYMAHSSFVKEMVEAKQIIKHADANSLVIADELCASTEMDSAIMIVASLLHIISNRKSSFIFATHLFDLSEHELVKELSNISCLHLKVVFEQDNLIFERTLTAGLPENRLYGVLVANKVIANKEFDSLTKRLKTKLASSNTVVGTSIPSRSRYNSRLWLEECAICKYKPQCQYSLPLDTHHIHMQCTASEEGFIDHYHKNDLHNLVSLCKVCHQEVHLGKIIIEGYIEMDTGKKLEWFRKEELATAAVSQIDKESNIAIPSSTKRKELSEEDRASIIEYYKNHSYKPKKIVHQEINEKMGIKIGYSSFSNLIKI